MGKSDAEIIATFNEQVNMTPDELEAWLDNPESEKAGTGVGLESGRKILQILRKNPRKKEDEYDEEDLQHMRKVVAYNSRHLAQEDRLKDTKTTEELEHTKSTISLKNWGHDPVKVKFQEEGVQEQEDNDDENEEGQNDVDKEEEDNDAEADEEEMAGKVDVDKADEKDEKDAVENDEEAGESDKEASKEMRRGRGKPQNRSQSASKAGAKRKRTKATTPEM